jgi:hypothetical protein
MPTTSTSYASEWSAAVERSERFGLTVPAHHVEPNKRYLNAQRMAKFPDACGRRVALRP